MITDFFSTSEELRKFVPDIGSSNNISEYEFSVREPENKLISLIGQATYDQLKAYYATPTPADAILGEGVTLIQGSLANLCGVNIFIFDSGERNANNSLYKYQEDQRLNAYMNGANAELGRLLTHLDANTEKYTAWPNMAMYKLREKQIIKTFNEFGEYYYIDESPYFFSKLIFLMSEITSDKINPIIGDIGDLDIVDDAAIITKSKQALAYLTVAMSLRRFDFAELPKTIRNQVSDSKSRTIRTDGQERIAVMAVSREIEGRGNDYIAALDRMMEKKTTGSLEVPEELNLEDDNNYLMT
ncbi:MAG: hypothetical protein PF450_16185 [Bacteroidales bacterium]|jgi:hypothetical protein|nr:hypothetical protein [Bacteroidales bacterium]